MCVINGARQYVVRVQKRTEIYSECRRWMRDRCTPIVTPESRGGREGVVQGEFFGPNSFTRNRGVSDFSPVVCCYGPELVLRPTADTFRGVERGDRNRCNDRAFVVVNR